MKPNDASPDGAQPSFARTADEVQQVHDLFTALLLGEIGIRLPDTVRTSVHSVADFTCWLLGHDHSDNFATNLEAIQKIVKKAGYEVTDVGHLTTREQMDAK